MEKETNETPKRKLENLSNDSGFHDFKVTPIFEGIFTGEIIKNGEGKEVGYMFEDMEGNEIPVGKTFRIQEAIEKCAEMKNDNPHLLIEFLGQAIKKKDGQKINKFKIDLVTE